jgi:hypothetical protein
MLKDKRLERICSDLVESQIKRESVIIRQLSCNSNDEARYGRFLQNERVSVKDLAAHLVSGQVLDLSGVEVLSVQDSSEIVVKGGANAVPGFGSIGNGLGYGYYIHPHLLFNAESGSLLGLGSLYSWHREDKRAENQARREHISSLDAEASKKYKATRHAEKVKIDSHKAISEKEGYRWIESAWESLSHCQGASSVTVIADCETDTYEYLVVLGDEDFARAGYPSCKVLVRSDNNRLLDVQKKVYNPETGKYYKQHVRLYDYLRECEVKQVVVVDIKESPSRTARSAQFSLKYERVRLRRPERLTEARAYFEGKKIPKFMEVTVLEFTEISPPPEGEKPIKWTLITTHTIDNNEFAIKIITYYQVRWRIEMYFRSLKKTGFAIENILNETKDGILKLTSTTLMAAVKIIQLIQARDNPEIVIESVFSPQEMEVLKILSKSLEGRTEKQRNPYPQESLAFGVWVIARLGGWNGYASQRKPGAYTLQIGLNKFYIFYEAYNMAKELILTDIKT